MEWQLPPEERSYLRELARRQAEIAALPVMAERERTWRALNDGPPGRARPPVIIETWTFDRDFMPASVFRCTTPTGRGIESQLLRNIRNHDLIDDDKVFAPAFAMGWFAETDQLGVRVESVHVKDAQGVATGYRFLHPIKDLVKDLDLVKPAVCRVDRAKTLAWQQFLQDLFGDYLRIELHSGTMGWTGLTSMVIRLMGMEAFFLAMYDTPDAVHQLMGRLRDNCLYAMHWAEGEGLLRLNHGTQDNIASSCCATNRLPAPGYQPDKVRLCDLWGSAESQETVGLSPAMFGEFCAPYYRAVCEPVGLLYWGCCEPADPLWEHISAMPHLKKVSISRWANERKMGEALRGTDIVFSRKPNPNLLGVSEQLDEAAWTAHLRETLEATPGVAVEFVVRDVYTVHGNIGKCRRAVELARQEIARHYGA